MGILVAPSGDYDICFLWSTYIQSVKLAHTNYKCPPALSLLKDKHVTENASPVQSRAR